MPNNPSQQAPQASSSSIPLGFGGVSADPGDHIAHFFRESDQRFSVLGPYVETGLQRGDRCVCIADSDTGAALCDWLAKRDVDVDAARDTDQLLVHPGRATMKHLAETISQTDDASPVRQDLAEFA